MKTYAIPSLAFLIAATCAGVAHARVHNGMDGIPGGNPTAVNSCFAPSGGSITNTCATSEGWYLPLVIDTTGAKSPVINARGDANPEFGWEASRCRGYRIDPNGVITSSTLWVYFDTGADQEKTLASMTLAANQTYLVGCYIGAYGQINSYRYAQ